MNKVELEKVIEQLEKESNIIKEAIHQLEEDINKLQLGDGTPYWNGKNAYDSIKTALLQLEYNKDLLNELDSDIEYLNTLTVSM